MSILDLYNSPPNDGRQIRFKNGEPDTTPSTYQAYAKNDLTSLKNSKLHYEGNEEVGYSTDGSPNVELYSDRYFAVGERPSDLSMNQGKTISTPNFTQPYTPNKGYVYEAMSGDLAALSDLQDASSTIQSLER